MVTTVLPFTRSARVRQESASSPSISTVQAPQVPWLQPTRVPVRPSLSRSTSTSSAPGSTNSACFAAVDGEDQRNPRHHALPSPDSSRLRCTGSTAVRYQALACGSVCGAQPSVATLTASSIARGVERLALERRLDRPGPHRPLPPSRHRRRGRRRSCRPPSAAPRRSTAPRRRADACGSTLAKRKAPVGGQREADGADDHAAPGAASARKASRPIARLAVGVLDDDVGAERQQRHGEVAIGIAGEEVAADRRHVADRPGRRSIRPPAARKASLGSAAIRAMVTAAPISTVSPSMAMRVEAEAVGEHHRADREIRRCWRPGRGSCRRRENARRRRRRARAAASRTLNRP